jgi:hypothetical protein
MSSSRVTPTKEALALAEALRRGRDPADARPKATIDEICKVLGAVRTDLGEPAQKTSVTVWFSRKRG